MPTAAGTSTRLRPRTGIIRSWRKSIILLEAIQGKAPQCTFETVKHICAAIRCIYYTALLPQFCAESICGRSGKEFLYDIGNNTPLQCIQQSIDSIFDSNTALYRLVMPLWAFLQKAREEGLNPKLDRLGAFERPASSHGKRRRLPSVEESIEMWLSSI